MTDGGEKPKYVRYGAIDLLGGVRMSGAIGEKAAVTQLLDRSGGFHHDAYEYEEVENDEGKNIREAVGGNWALKVNETILLRTFDDFFAFENRTPRLSCVYSRGFGHLMQVHFGVSDLIRKMVQQNVASQQDLMVMENLRGRGFDLAVTLTFAPDGQPALYLSQVQLLPVPTIVASKQEAIGPDQYGFVRGRPHFHWLGNFETFQGKMGVEVDDGGIVLYYQMGQKRLDVYRVSREVPGVAKFDRQLQQSVPSNDDLDGLKKAIFGGSAFLLE